MSISSVLESAREEQGTNQFPPSNWEQQLATWNATQQDYPTHDCVHHLVARQATATPDAVALVAGKQILTYRELNQQANQLAHYLQALGVGPNTLVGMCVERSLDMVVGLLGILKARGAYVPLDPAYPPERLAFMLEDSAAPILVTYQRIANQLTMRGLRVVCLDADTPALAVQSESDPASTVTADDLAYVIYTSGSTGRPKGVQITHRSLLNLVYWHRQTFEVTAADRATQFFSPGFDVTGEELWPHLTIGASVYLIDEETRLDPRAMCDWLVKRGITITILPTALVESLIVLEWPSTMPLRVMLVGGDKLYRYPPPTLPFALINNYGPTEATVVATSGQVPSAEHPDGPPSIGCPIANTQIYILAEHLKQVPIGVPGELYIGGAGVARGYLNRPELTAERFIPHPFSSEPEARLYKTGDLARFLPDGQIAFMGRTDHQVKIRGNRVELGEIEAVLNQHPVIHQAVVVAREDVPGEKRLAAYIVLNAGAHVSSSSLQETLLAYLPDYMLPAAFVSLEALPLTPNGKVDRAALPAPDTTNTLRDEAIAVPSTPTEKQLVEIVAPLLGLEQFGIDDNFFMLGGNSLMGAQVVMRVAETFGIDLPLRTLFDAPTVRELAAEIERLIFAMVEAMSDEEIQRLLQ
jgi:amino acid adenylation domain-containing protein